MNESHKLGSKCTMQIFTDTSIDWQGWGWKLWQEQKNEFSYISFYGATTVNGNPMAILEILMK